MAVMGMNLFGHIAESYNEQWGFDPGSIPILPPLPQIPCLKNFMPGIIGGSGMVKFFIFSSHTCHCLHALNFQVLATHNHNVALHALFIGNSFTFLVVLISILLQLPVMNSLHFIVLPLMLLTMLHAGSLDSTSWLLLDICFTMWMLSGILSTTYLLGQPTTSFVNPYSIASAPPISLSNFPLLSRLLNT